MASISRRRFGSPVRASCRAIVWALASASARAAISRRSCSDLRSDPIARKNDMKKPSDTMLDRPRS